MRRARSGSPWSSSQSASTRRGKASSGVSLISFKSATTCGRGGGRGDGGRRGMADGSGQDCLRQQLVQLLKVGSGGGLEFELLGVREEWHVVLLFTFWHGVKELCLPHQPALPQVRQHQPVER